MRDFIGLTLRIVVNIGNNKFKLTKSTNSVMIHSTKNNVKRMHKTSVVDKHLNIFSLVTCELQEAQIFISIKLEK